MGEGGDSEGDDSGGEGDGSGGEGDGSGGKGDGSGGEGDRALMGVDHEARGKQALQLLGVDRVVHEERVLPPLVVHEASWGRLGHHRMRDHVTRRVGKICKTLLKPGLPKDTWGKQATLALCHFTKPSQTTLPSRAARRTNATTGIGAIIQVVRKLLTSGVCQKPCKSQVIVPVAADTAPSPPSFGGKHPVATAKRAYQRAPARPMTTCMSGLHHGRKLGDKASPARPN